MNDITNKHKSRFGKGFNAESSIEVTASNPKKSGRPIEGKESLNKNEKIFISESEQKMLLEIKSSTGIGKSAIFRRALLEYAKNHHPELVEKYMKWGIIL